MGSILQERVAQRCVERFSIGDREWKKKASRSNSRPTVAGTKMGRRQSQKKFPQPQCSIQSQENNHEKKPQRWKHKSNTSSTRCSAAQQHSAQGTSMLPPAAPEEDRMKIKLSSAAEDRKHKHTSALLCHSLPRSSPDQQGELSPKQQRGGLSAPPQQDSDTDLSEAERLPLSSCPIAPQLELRPEVMEDEDPRSHCHRVRGRDHGGVDFPDFLPPPFNSWSLSQLALFYNTEDRGALRPRPVGLLERFLERLLQLEWHQIQTVQAERGTQEVSVGTSSCQRSTAAAPSRLSSPKCILQCQRAFPLPFLSSLCRICSSTCSTSCCRSIHSHSHQSRLSPMLDRSRGPPPLPKRSCSESRVHSSDRRLRAQTFGSPTRTNSYLRRMQASGNIRNPIQGVPGRSHSTVRGCGDQAGRGDGSDRTAGGEKHLTRSETSQRNSESRRGRAERSGATNWTEQETPAVLDDFPGSRRPPVRRPSGSKQVEFVTEPLRD